MDTFALDKVELQRRFDQGLQASLSGDGHTLAQKVALTCRILFAHGHAVGLTGQITARCDAPGTYLTQVFGLGLEEIRAGNLLTVDENLEVLEGRGVPNPANRFHSWIYRARPDVRCIVHTHAPHAAALGMLEVPLEVAQMDACPLYGEVAFVPTWPGVPHGNEEGRLISESLGNKRAALLSHHGLLVAGQSVEEACMLALAFEHAARLQLLASAAGTIKPIAPKFGAEAHDVMLKPAHVSAAFGHQARRALRDHADCLA
jgi:L-fuculose-phosphate aldolase